MSRLLPIISVSVMLLASAAVSNAQKFYPESATPDTSLMQLPYYSSSECLIIHDGYVTSYDTLTLNPRWVAYELASDKLGDGVERSGSFKRDPCIGCLQASNKDYSHSGYDKGHMAPAADMRWSDKAMKESFYFTNVSPQRPRLNRGSWKMLEGKTRDMALRYGRVWIVMGPLICEGYSTIGADKVVVPQYFFKALLAFDGESYHSAAFLFENVDRDQSLLKVIMTVDSLEGLLDVNLFKNLPADCEGCESSVSLADWGL